MQDLISSYLIQTQECNLPGLGSFSINTLPASLDVANKVMIPHTEEIIFSERSDSLNDQFVNYIAYKKNIEKEDAAIRLREYCSKAKEDLMNGKEIHFDSIGSLYANSAGAISFQPLPFNKMLQAVPAVRVIHKNAGHNVLVGDNEKSSIDLNQCLQEEEVKAPRWKIAAIILLLIGLSVLAYHFYMSSGIASHSDFPVASPSNSYISK